MAKNLIGQQFAGKFIEVENESELLSFSKEDKKIPYLVCGSCKGADLTGIKYEQLIDYAKFKLDQAVGEWKHYYPNGSIMLEEEGVDSITYVQNFWKTDSTQTLKNGDGRTFIY